MDALFKNTLLQPAKLYNELKIVSGYSSYSFLKEVSESLPNLKITLILGMTPYGISKGNLEGYRELCKTKSNIEVYLQIEEPLTHIKLYQWYINENPTECFIGSANFSHSGFSNQREILISSKLDYTNIITDTLKMSVHCSSQKIEDNIKVYNDEIELGIEHTMENINNSDDSISTEDLKDEFKPRRMYGKTLKQLKRNYLLDDDQTEVDLLFHNKKINRGLNKGSNSYLDIDKNIEYFNRHLKRNVIGTLEINGRNLEIIREGPFSRKLVILENDWDFHKVICECLGIDFTDTIDYADLDREGLKKLIFTKIGNNRFKLDF